MVRGAASRRARGHPPNDRPPRAPQVIELARVPGGRREDAEERGVRRVLPPGAAPGGFVLPPQVPEEGGEGVSSARPPSPAAAGGASSSSAGRFLETFASSSGSSSSWLYGGLIPAASCSLGAVAAGDAPEAADAAEALLSLSLLSLSVIVLSSVLCYGSMLYEIRYDETALQACYSVLATAYTW